MPPIVSNPSTQRLRLHYLDGCRGLAALYVVLHHAFLEVAAVNGWLPERWLKATLWTWNGQIAVQIFIVLSGYCLMLPVVRAGDLKGGRLGFIRRRARRILPPYYSALALSLALIFFVPGMNTLQGLRWDLTFPAFAPGTLSSHLLLLQDFKAGWISRINYPMWSIAQEWQIYFVFAFVLLPLWTRAGIVTTVLFTLLVSVALRQLPGDPLAYASPEFLFLFGVGMFAASISFAESSHWLAWARDKLPWGVVSVGLWAWYAAITWMYPDQAHFRSIPFALLAGTAALCTLLVCTNSAQHRRATNPLLRLCEWEPVVALGVFSYSLYLVHAPLLSMFTLVMHGWRVSGVPAVMAEMLIAVPIVVVVSYGFHLLAERPFMLGRPIHLKEAEKAAVLDTAP